jgi:hypothetical protein
VVVKRLIQRGRTSAGRDAGWIVARSKGRKAERCNFSSWFFEAAEDTWASVYQIDDTASNHPIILFLQLSLSQQKMGFPFSSFWTPSAQPSRVLNRCSICGNDWVVDVPWSGGRSWTGLALGVKFATRLLVYDSRRAKSQSDLFARELQKPQRQPL